MGYKDKHKLREYQRAYERNKAKRLRPLAIQYLGGRCVSCGISDCRVLEFEHRVPVRGIRHKTGINGAFLVRILAGKEQNVQLMCANCHRIKTAKDFGYDRSC